MPIETIQRSEEHWTDPEVFDPERFAPGTHHKPFTFLQLLLPIFAAAIIGGIGSPLGAIVGGFIVAFSEILITYAFKSFLVRLVPEDYAPEGLVQLLSTDYKFAVSFAILVIVLIIMPTGIFKGRTL